MKPKTSLRFLLALACMSFFFVSCGGGAGGGDDDEDADDGDITYSGVHIVGQQDDLPSYWHDGTATALDILEGDDPYGVAYAVAVDGTDVYIGGFYFYDY